MLTYCASKRAPAARLKLAEIGAKFSDGKKYTPKVFSALKTEVPQQAKKRFGGFQRACFKGKKESAYTPESLQGVCGRPLRSALVYRFWPPKFGRHERL